MNTDADIFDYAHNDTSKPERESATAGINKFNFSPLVQEIRRGAFARNIPVSSDETLAFLCMCVRAAKPGKILEIGTAIGVSGICMLEQCAAAHMTTIEINPVFASEAKVNFAAANLSDRAHIICGDAAEVIENLKEKFDFIFLDGPKVQYVKYLPKLKELLNAEGMLFADDVLLYGWVNGEKETPKKRRMLVWHIREYLDAVTNDTELMTTVINVGDGVALSIKKTEE